MTKFRDLSVGDTFDFIGPDRMLNSFFRRCRKISPRGYVEIEDKRNTHRIGSIDCEVYHVEPMPSRHGYNPVAVNQAIEASNRSGRRIGAREAKAIHALLNGR